MLVRKNYNLDNLIQFKPFKIYSAYGIDYYLIAMQSCKYFVFHLLEILFNQIIFACRHWIIFVSAKRNVTKFQIRVRFSSFGSCFFDSRYIIISETRRVRLRWSPFWPRMFMPKMSRLEMFFPQMNFCIGSCLEIDYKFDIFLMKMFA